LFAQVCLSSAKFEAKANGTVMIRYNSLYAITEFKVGRFDHPRDHVHRDPKEEVAFDYSVNRVDSGGFALDIDGLHWELSPGDLFLTYPGMIYRCRHRESVPTDICTTVACLPQVEPEEISAFHHSARNLPVRRPNNRLTYLFLLMGKEFRERLAVEETVHEVIAEATCEPDARQTVYRDHQLHWYAERIDAVRVRLESDYATEHSLSSMAKSVGMSAFHFSRIFRELTGAPPHTYLRRARLRNAARQLREGASVTEACLASGFQNLSHFTRQFGRSFGVPPSIYAAQFSSVPPGRK
jgi:AraC-like DNA-binding protein